MIRNDVDFTVLSDNEREGFGYAASGKQQVIVLDLFQQPRACTHLYRAAANYPAAGYSRKRWDYRTRSTENRAGTRRSRCPSKKTRGAPKQLFYRLLLPIAARIGAAQGHWGRIGFNYPTGKSRGRTLNQLLQTTAEMGNGLNSETDHWNFNRTPKLPISAPRTWKDRSIA